MLRWGWESAGQLGSAKNPGRTRRPTNSGVIVTSSRKKIYQNQINLDHRITFIKIFDIFDSLKRVLVRFEQRQLLESNKDFVRAVKHLFHLNKISFLDRNSPINVSSGSCTYNREDI